MTSHRSNMPNYGTICTGCSTADFKYAIILLLRQTFYLLHLAVLRDALELAAPPGTPGA